MYAQWYTAVLTVVTIFISFTLAGPMDLDAMKVEKRAIDPERLERLKADFRGIFWDNAVQDCSEVEFNIIAEAVRIIAEEVFPLAGDREDRKNSPALNRFFIRPFEGGMTRHWIDDRFPHLSDVYLTFIGAMENVEQYIRNGKRGRTPKRGNQIMITCKPYASHPCRGNVLAKTGDPQVDPEGWSMVLCPKFFEGLQSPRPPGALQYLNDLANAGPKDVSELPSLQSFEGTIIHELFHADPASGMSEGTHITDMVDNIIGIGDGLKIYGATLSHQYAWMKTIESNFNPTGPNEDVARNADNFAWYYTNLYFAKRWGWNDDGRDLALSTSPAVAAVDLTTAGVDGETVQIAPYSIPHAPPGCYFLDKSSLETLDWFCPYRGSTQGEWMAELIHPFESYGGCELSFECHMPANNTHNVDPSCKCRCDNQDTPLTDVRCAGFEGVIVNTPTPPPETTTPPPPPSDPAPEEECNFNWCGAPFCDPECGP